MPSEALRPWPQFADLFADYNHDFYRIDPHLFSPAVITLVNLDTGRSHRFGRLMPEIIAQSFNNSHSPTGEALPAACQATIAAPKIKLLHVGGHALSRGEFRAGFRRTVHSSSDEHRHYRRRPKASRSRKPFQSRSGRSMPMS